MSSDKLTGYRDFMTQIIESGKKLVVCTHGKEGSTALTSDGKWLETPVIGDYTRLDTNGAGDGFFAGFLYGHSEGYDLPTCLRLGTIVGGLTVSSTELLAPAQ